MYNLTKEKKVNFIIKEVDELRLSSYEISKNTTLSVAGINKILHRITKNPQEKTLDLIIGFLESKNLNTKLFTVQEPQLNYDKKEENDLRALNNCHLEVNKLTIEVIKLQNILRNNKVIFKNIFDEDD